LCPGCRGCGTALPAGEGSWARGQIWAWHLVAGVGYAAVSKNHVRVRPPCGHRRAWYSITVCLVVSGVPANV
jgi:hypothetical protein